MVKDRILSVHHIVMMLIALAVIWVLGKLIKADFGFRLGDGTYLYPHMSKSMMLIFCMGGYV